MKIIDKIIKSNILPLHTNVLWYDTNTNTLKAFLKTGWQNISGNSREPDSDITEGVSEDYIIRYTTYDSNPCIFNNFSTYIKKQEYKDGAGTLVLKVPIDNIILKAGSFQYISNLSTIDLPNITILPLACFNGCLVLDSFKFPNTLTNISSECFNYCGSISIIDIPNNVTSIGENAFSNCHLTVDNFINNSSLDAISNNYWGIIFHDQELDGMMIDNNTITYVRPNIVLAKIPDNVDINQNVFSLKLFLEKIIIPEHLTIFGDEFLGCTNLETVIILGEVQSMGNAIFLDCTSLKEVYINKMPPRLVGFRGCSSLESFDILDTVTTLSGTFYGCTSLKSVTMTDSVTSIEDYSFFNCTSLSTITLSNNLTKLGAGAFRNSGLINIVIPDSCEEIYADAFYECTKLEQITLPHNLKLLPSTPYYSYEGGFENCVSLKSIVIPDSVILINDRCFKNCKSLLSINIPKNVISIGSEVFAFCNNLNTISVDLLNTYYDSRDNCNAIIKTKTNTLITGCKNTIIPNNIATIASYAFSDTSFTEPILIIPDSVTEIGELAFVNCAVDTVIIPANLSNVGYAPFDGAKVDTMIFTEGITCIPSIGRGSTVKTVSFPDSVLTIATSAFLSCTELLEITIPKNVTEIQSHAFAYCDSLLSITMCSSTPCQLSDNALPFGVTIYVPDSAVDSYKAAWPSYALYITSAYTPLECVNLSITAQDVTGNASTTKITYEAITNGISKTSGELVENVVVTGTATSDKFEQNKSYTDTVERTITFEFMGVTATTTITQGVWVDQSYEVVLNGQWRLSETQSNPDSSLYDGVYESFSNKGVNDSEAIMYLDLIGYTEFDVYIRSYAESSYDYVTISEPNSTTVKVTTSGNQNSGQDINSYTKVHYDNLTGEDRITITYRKDSSSNEGTDLGYVLIPK